MMLVLYEGEETEDAETTARHSEVDELRNNIQKVRSKIERFRARTESMDSYFNTKYTEQVQELSELVKELNGRREALLKGQKYERPKHEELLDEHGNATEELMKETRQHEERAFKKTKPSDRLRKIYRDIAMKCHPDRTKRKELHEIFKKAYQAYRINDMNTMQDLWNEVQYITGHIKAMMDRIDELRRDLSSCNVEYTQLVTATSGQLLMLFENEDTREIADSKFLDHTKELKEKILLQLEQLRSIHSQTGRTTIFRTFL